MAEKVYIVSAGWFSTPICVCETRSKAERYIKAHDPTDKYMYVIEEVPFYYSRTLNKWELRRETTGRDDPASVRSLAVPSKEPTSV